MGPLERVAGARLSWSGLFFPLSVASGGSGGAEWAEVGGQRGLCCLLSALPGPSSQLASSGSQVPYH